MLFLQPLTFLRFLPRPRHAIPLFAATGEEYTDITQAKQGSKDAHRVRTGLDWNLQYKCFVPRRRKIFAGSRNFRADGGAHPADEPQPSARSEQPASSRQPKGTLQLPREQQQQQQGAMDTDEARGAKLLRGEGEVVQAVESSPADVGPSSAAAAATAAPAPASNSAAAAAAAAAAGGPTPKSARVRGARAPKKAASAAALPAAPEQAPEQAALTSASTAGPPPRPSAGAVASAPAPQPEATAAQLVSKAPSPPPGTKMLRATVGTSQKQEQQPSSSGGAKPLIPSSRGTKPLIPSGRGAKALAKQAGGPAPAAPLVGTSQAALAPCDISGASGSRNGDRQSAAASVGGKRPRWPEDSGHDGRSQKKLRSLKRMQLKKEGPWPSPRLTSAASALGATAAPSSRHSDSDKNVPLSQLKKLSPSCRAAAAPAAGAAAEGATVMAAVSRSGSLLKTAMQQRAATVQSVVVAADLETKTSVHMIARDSGTGTVLAAAGAAAADKQVASATEPASLEAGKEVPAGMLKIPVLSILEKGKQQQQQHQTKALGRPEHQQQHQLREMEVQHGQQDGKRKTNVKRMRAPTHHDDAYDDVPDYSKKASAPIFIIPKLPSLDRQGSSAAAAVPKKLGPDFIMPKLPSEEQPGSGRRVEGRGEKDAHPPRRADGTHSSKSAGVKDKGAPSQESLPRVGDVSPRVGRKGPPSPAPAFPTLYCVDNISCYGAEELQIALKQLCSGIEVRTRLEVGRWACFAAGCRLPCRSAAHMQRITRSQNMESIWPSLLGA
jgi:hypothetical protein